MSTGIVVVIVIVVLVVIGAVAYAAQAQARRRGLRQRFGPEYDRAVDEHANTKEAEQELLAREKRHDGLDIRPLDPASRERHLTEWRQVQERFVDSPETAVFFTRGPLTCAVNCGDNPVRLPPGRPLLTTMPMYGDLLPGNAAAWLY